MKREEKEKVETTKKIISYVKVNRKGSREAELERSNGFVSKHKIHTSKKNIQ